MLSNRARYNVDVFMPTISAKVKQKAAAPSKQKVIDLSTAENWFMRGELVRIFKSSMAREFDNKHLSYSNGFQGDPRLLLGLASFFNDHFQPHMPVEPSHIVTGAGASALLDSLMFNICDPGDGMLVVAPYWSGFDFCFTVRPSIRAIPVLTHSLEDSFSLRVVDHLRNTFEKESAQGPIRGVVLCNPHNPLGRCFPKAVLAECLRFCREKDIHFISDEIYALSTFEAPDHTEAAPFESVLSLDLELVGCDPGRVHVVWSMSKDFGCSGLRMGCLVSQGNSDLRVAVALTACNQISSLTTLAVNSVISLPRCQLRKFIATNQSSLGRAYSQITSFFRNHGIEYFPCNAGVYVWARLGGHNIHTAEEEMEIWAKLQEHGVSVGVGKDYHSAESSWFRVTFAVPEDILAEALLRMELALGLRRLSSCSSEPTEVEKGKEMVVSAGQQGMLEVIKRVRQVLWTKYQPWNLATRCWDLRGG